MMKAEIINLAEWKAEKDKEKAEEFLGVDPEQLMTISDFLSQICICPSCVEKRVSRPEENNNNSK